MRLDKVLVVGGGIAGMSTAIMLRRLGVEIDLIDLDPDWRVYGAGITITGPTLRAFGQIGVLDAVLREGYAGDGLDVRSVDGAIQTRIASPVRGPQAFPGGGGIMRPKLHAILSRRVRESGASVRLGLTVDRLVEDGQGVEATFSDGTTSRCSLVVGADGVGSKMRGLLFPGAPGPAYTGQHCWRVRLPRPAEIDRRNHFLGGPVKVGLTPVSDTEMYMFLLQARPTKARPDEATLSQELKGLLHGFGGVLAEVRESLSPSSEIIVRPLESLLLPPPWFKGRAVLIGDAAHPTTPQLASGAGLAVEDAIVLGEELAGADTLEAALAGFMRRRWSRCRMVVENSIEIGRREQAGEPAAFQAALVEQSLQALAEPI
jgi:2-polyprenyl-6-methoxyphenol hydroxylase-like FAD-dependent oxidoreductase